MTEARAVGDHSPGGRLISDALTQLSPHHRAVIWRAHYLGWTTRRIAGDLGIAEDVVKCRLHNALHALRPTLESSAPLATDDRP
jgi:DNA-directed RNA polymerase specialized sigma24 family protein